MRYWNAPELEEYILSVCLQNKKALSIAVSELDSMRDFKDPRNRKAFGLLESRMRSNEDVDMLVVINDWVDLGIYKTEAEARRIATCSNGDYDFDPKVKELKRIGGMRKSQQDISKLNQATQEDTSPEKIAQKAFEMAKGWITGGQKKYLSGSEIEEKQKTEVLGEKLISGIPLMDSVLYETTGQLKSTIKATVFREKHGKTRHACWEVAQDLRQGTKVLYITLEGADYEIKDNIKDVLRDEWDSVADNIFIKSGSVDSDEIQSAIIEAVFVDNIDKVVIDYLQRMKHPDSRRLGENENTNRCCSAITDLCVRYNLNGHYLAQARQPERSISGYGNVPKVHDVYGSNQIIKDASIIMVGFRPKLFEELIIENSMSAKVKAPDGIEQEYLPINSVLMKPVLCRKKITCLHKWVHFVDTDNGYTLHRQEML